LKVKKTDIKNSKLPKVCICIPTYNAAGTIRETLKSILSQTYQNLIIQISDNSSTDDTLKIIESFADSRLTIHKHHLNIGAEGNFTRCIEYCRGDYTAIFHADDIYEVDMVSKQVEFLENNPDIGAVFTQAILVNEQNEPLGVVGSVPGSKGHVTQIGFQKLLKSILLYHNYLVCSSVMVRTYIYKDQIKDWGNSLFRSASDVDVCLRLSMKQPIAILNEKLMQYRISNAQYSNIIRNRTQRADFYLVMDHYLAKPEVLSFINKNDIRHYRWLERHESVARAINLFIIGKVSEAHDLCKVVLCWDSIYAAIFTRRGLVTLAGGLLILSLSHFKHSRFVIEFIKKIKKVQWR